MVVSEYRRMTEDSDWRLQGQEKYLQAVALKHRQYRRKSPNSDHDHCEFCWAKFMEEDRPDVLHEGYCTPDSTHWICQQCYADFHKRFQWSLQE